MCLRRERSRRDFRCTLDFLDFLHFLDFLDFLGFLFLDFLDFLDLARSVYLGCLISYAPLCYLDSQPTGLDCLDEITAMARAQSYIERFAFLTLIRCDALCVVVAQ